jgi:hypothetical protein
MTGVTSGAFTVGSVEAAAFTVRAAVFFSFAALRACSAASSAAAWAATSVSDGGAAPIQTRSG